MGLKEWNIGDLKPRPIISAEEISEEAKQKQMKEANMPTTNKETKELMAALGMVTESTIKSFEDGKLTPTDAFNYVDDVPSVITGILGADKIDNEWAYMTEAQKDECIQAFNEKSGLKIESAEIVQHFYNAAYELGQGLRKAKLWKPGEPEAPPVAE